MESEYMSFSTEVKNELCSVSMSRACCTRAEAYGALLHASVFSHKEIRLSAENAVVVRRLIIDELSEFTQRGGKLRPQAAAHHQRPAAHRPHL